MRTSTCALILSACFAGCKYSDAFSPIVSNLASRHRLIKLGQQDNSWQELESKILLEDGAQQSSLSHSRSRRIVLPGKNNKYRSSTILVSAAATPISGEDIYDFDNVDQYQDGSPLSNSDPYEINSDERLQMQKIQQFREQKDAPRQFGDRLKQMDLQDIIITLILPTVALFAAGRWTYNRVSSRVTDKTENVLDDFAKEMLYHDGNYNEMKLCIADYNRKLVYLGPNKGDLMLKRYLELYAKKKTINPQAIASLSYVFSEYKLSEEKAAKVLVSLCKQMGSEKISSAGKLLFLGSRVLKSEQGQEALKPIKTLIMSTYRDESVAETLIETSQQAIAEAAYRTVVLSGGKEQKGLTPGWEVLGLDRESAERIYNEQAKEGFMSDRETMYGGQTTKYDKKGRILDKKTGKLTNPEEADDDDDDDDDGPMDATSNVYECGECGYTLFVAQGRESKFFGSGFKCPECGAAKKKFQARDDMDE